MFFCLERSSVLLEMKKFFLVSGIVLLSTSSVYAGVEQFTDYSSIPSYVHNPLDQLIEFRVIDGTAGSNFRPLDLINRAELCKILVQSTGIQTKIPEVSFFSDVDSQAWFYPYVETAKFYKWVDGYEDGTFRPGNTLNRAEAAKILINAFGFEASQREVDVDWYDKYVRVLTEKSLLPYGADTDFSVATNPTRSEITEQIYRFMVETKKITPIGGAPIELDYVKH